MRCITVVALGLFLCGTGTGAAAQGMSVEGGVGLAQGESSFQVGIRGMSTRTGGVGVDFAVATYPDAISNGAFSALTDLAIEYRAPLGPNASASIRAGGSALLVSGGGISGSAGGINAGTGVILGLSEKTAFRFDFTYRVIFSGGQSASLSSLTFGIVIGH
ncbi:MAG TPA: hypothetical protein VFD85_09715 [Gemmatimonadales bacterium]|nr:hypothetical protein [Gemmatimonadales bacterium]